MEGAVTFIGAIPDGVGTAVSSAGTVVTALLTEGGELAALLPVVGLAIGIGLVGWGVRTIKSLTWGF